jgi:GT2 family glycosyltransferase
VIGAGAVVSRVSDYDAAGIATKIVGDSASKGRFLRFSVESGHSVNKSNSRPLSIVVPTYRRDSVLIATIGHLLELDPAPAEILVVDQTERHQETVEQTLRNWDAAGAIRLVRLIEPSITRAMNRGLCEAKQTSVLFVDDDIVPEPGLLEMHWRALERTGAALVAGRVIQPWHKGKDLSKEGFHFASMQAGWIRDFMGCNFTVRREIALKLGGFDEQFVTVAYNFEAEFAYRLCKAGHKIFYEPAACIHHLRISEGGTRTFGDHLRSFRPNHAVGAYYFILRTWSGWQSLVQFLKRPLRAIATRHHLCRPWWVPATLVAEFSGMGWALVLAAQGPRYLSPAIGRKAGGIQ